MSLLWLGTLAALVATTGMIVALRTKPVNLQLFSAFFAVGMVACLILVLSIVTQLMENLSR